MTIRPLHDRVLITRKAADETTASGLYLAPNAREKSNVALVVAVGPGLINKDGVLVPATVQPGQTVLIGKWAGDVVQLEGVEHLIIREQDILAITD